MDIIKFNYENREVRTIQDENGDPWWVVSDICDVLALTNPSMAIDALEDDERAKQSLGRQGDAWTVNESGLYTLIIRSNKPEAKKFKRWITHEVLPSIRKTGRYEFGQNVWPSIFPNLIAAIRYIQALGLKIRKSKVYVDREKGLIQINPDGSVLRSEIEAYAAGVAKDQDASGIRVARNKQKDAETDRLVKLVKTEKAIADLLKTKLAVVKGIGFRGNQAIVRAAGMIRDETGIDLIEQYGASHLYGGSSRDTPGVFVLTEDLLRDFIDDECETGDRSTTIGSTVLYERFLMWLKKLNPEAEKPSHKTFGTMAIKVLGRPTKKNGLYLYRGVRLAQVH